MYRTLMLLAVSTTLPAAGQVSGLDDIEGALSAWETSRNDVDYNEVLQWSETVRSKAAPGERSVLDRLLRIAENYRLETRARSVALNVACEIADQKSVDLVVDTMTKVLSRLQQSPADHERAGMGLARKSIGTLLSTLVSGGCVERLMDIAPAPQPVLDFLTRAYIAGYMSENTRDVCSRLILDCNVPLKSRQDAVATIIESETWRRGGVPVVLVDILDSTSFPRLRGLVRAETTVDKFNFAAADALSYLGDSKIIPDFEARKEGFRIEHVNLESELSRYIWRIEVQHPPDKLLDYIASDGWPMYRDHRIQSVRRAVKLGIPKERIREAILKHNQNALDSQKQTEMIELKWFGIKWGILQESDLPDIDLVEHVGETVIP